MAEVAVEPVPVGVLAVREQQQLAQVHRAVRTELPVGRPVHRSVATPHPAVALHRLPDRAHPGLEVGPALAAALPAQVAAQPGELAGLGEVVPGGVGVGDAVVGRLQRGQPAHHAQVPADVVGECRVRLGGFPGTGVSGPAGLGAARWQVDPGLGLADEVRVAARGALRLAYELVALRAQVPGVQGHHPAGEAGRRTPHGEHGEFGGEQAGGGGGQSGQDRPSGLRQRTGQVLPAEERVHLLVLLPALPQAGPAAGTARHQVRAEEDDVAVRPGQGPGATGGQVAVVHRRQPGVEHRRRQHQHLGVVRAGVRSVRPDHCHGESEGAQRVGGLGHPGRPEVHDGDRATGHPPPPRLGRDAPGVPAGGLGRRGVRRAGREQAVVTQPGEGGGDGGDRVPGGQPGHHVGQRRGAVELVGQVRGDRIVDEQAAGLPQHHERAVGQPHRHVVRSEARTPHGSSRAWWPGRGYHRPRRRSRLLSSSRSAASDPE